MDAAVSMMRTAQTQIAIEEEIESLRRHPGLRNLQPTGG
jgi:hypothetical protein